MKKIEQRKDGSRRVSTVNKEPSMTDQSWAEHVNITTITNKYFKTGQITHLAKNAGVYADVSEIKDLQTSLEKVTKAQEAFDALPAELRNKFNQSPIEMVNFLNNPANWDEAVKLGIYKESQIQEEVIDPSPKIKKTIKKETILPANDDE